MKRTSLVLGMLLIILLALSTSLMAQTATPPASGDGTSGDPYQIATLNNLYWLTQTTSEWVSGKYFIQTANIDATSTNTWDGGAGFSPIGNSTTTFAGSYNGQNNTISGLYINRSSTNYIGLFGHADGATIENLGVINVDITGKQRVGGLVGYSNTSSAVSNCYSTGTEVHGLDFVGGLVGYNTGSSTINSSYSTVYVSGDNAYFGGLVGINNDPASISNCYSIGGVARLAGAFPDRLGAFVGYNNGIITNCYTNGDVYNSDGKRGFRGYIVSGTSTNNFWDSQASNQTSAYGATAKNTAQMKTLATFTDTTTTGLTTAWDFVGNYNDDSGNDDIWDMDYSGLINAGYPYLSWEDGDDVSLPVELSSFSVHAQNNAVIIAWTTESELDNLGFILERSEGDKASWQEMASYRTHDALKGQGSTSSRTEYTFTDITVEAGESYYYRLSNVSLQGEITTHPPIFIQMAIQPTEFILYQNTPNPFNANTWISYQLPELSSVTVKIYNVRGQLVKTLLDGEQTPGIHRLRWDALDLQDTPAASGVYFCRMKSNSHAQTVKMVLLR